MNNMQPKGFLTWNIKVLTTLPWLILQNISSTVLENFYHHVISYLKKFSASFVSQSLKTNLIFSTLSLSPRREHWCYHKCYFHKCFSEIKIFFYIFIPEGREFSVQSKNTEQIRHVKLNIKLMNLCLIPVIILLLRILNPWTYRK